MLKPINLRVNFGRLSKASRIIEGNSPVISWGGASSIDNDYQTAFKVVLKNADEIIWDSGVIESNEQFYKCDGLILPSAKRIDFSVAIAGKDKVLSEEVFDYFYRGDIKEINNALWLEADEDKESVPIYFKKEFSLSEKPISAALFVCGVGYHKVSVNGKSLDSFALNPAISDYTKACFYEVLPEIENLNEGKNNICITIADGWRRNFGEYLHGETPHFFGKPALICALRLTFDSHEEWLYSDSSWKWGRGPIAFSHLFDGETYDANINEKALRSVYIGGKDLGELRPLTIEKIARKKVYEPISIVRLSKGRFVIDFGQNIAGVFEIKLPENMVKGQRITIKAMEFLKEDGSLFMENLRAAKATDTYIASGDSRDLKTWSPEFLYHGFRYLEVEGLELIENGDIKAIALYTDIDNRSFFKCGNPLINQIHENCLQTERANIHSIFTDCPQRDERMGWLNDATVRFEATPYNFEIGKMFPKVLKDIVDAQDKEGAIPDTVPHIYGTKPADPVCSSFLLLAKKAYEFTGNKELLEKVYKNLCAWENCLLGLSKDYIVEHSNYGDWASPAYACIKGSLGDGAKSIKVPGAFMSTGYFYYNALLLSEFAGILGKNDDNEKYKSLAENIKKAILEKWFDEKTAKVCGGEMSCQAFSLWLGILPESKRKTAAKVMRDALVESDYRFTTGNLCTRYLLDMLIEYGYINEFYEFLTRDTYPSYGFMIQNEATTIWERFELKTETEMNSHNHPMYGSVDYCFYKYLAGISALDKAFSEVEIKPYFPDKLLSVNCLVETVKGDISVRWVKQFGKLNLFVNIPFNVKANVHFDGKVHNVGSGFWKFSKDI